MKKLVLFLIMLFTLTGCASSKDFYSLNTVWNYSLDSTQYTLEYKSLTQDFISIEVTIENLVDGKNYPLYFSSKNECFSYVEVDNTKYDIVRYGKYYGEIEYTENKFVLNCYLSAKGKKKKLDRIKVTMDDAISTLYPNRNPNRMFELHYIRIDLK